MFMDFVLTGCNHRSLGCVKRGGQGSPADTMETLPMQEFAEEAPVAKQGDIPDPPMPPRAILDAVLEGMTQKPGVAFDPRAQHKKQFRAHVKGRVPFYLLHSATYHHQ